jgi:hypothetical protein
MGGITGDGGPAGGIRASDAERDATPERLSSATGDGRLTLAEFGQRMEHATTAQSRAELDRLVADLPTDPGPAATAGADRGAARPAWHGSPIGGTRILRGGLARTSQMAERSYRRSGRVRRRSRRDRFTR